MRIINASKRAAALTLIALFVLSCVPRAHARRHHHHHSAQSKLHLEKTSLTAACDFDADFSQARATLQSNGVEKRIKISFADARSMDLAFATGSVDSGNLVAGDIDRDGDIDLVWIESKHRDAVVLINDGDGHFAAAEDNTPYASELDELFNSYDPSNRSGLKRGRRSSTLTSSSFHNVGLTVFVESQAKAIRLVPVANREPLKVQSGFVQYLCERGPPAILS